MSPVMKRWGWDQRVRDICKWSRQAAVVSGDNNLWKMQLRRRVLSKRTKLFRDPALTQIFAVGRKGGDRLYGDCGSPIKVAPATWRWVEGIKPPGREERARGWLGEKRVDSERRKSGSGLPYPLFLLRGRTRRCQATGAPLSSSSTLEDVTQSARKKNELLTFRGSRLTWTVALWRTLRGILMEPRRISTLSFPLCSRKGCDGARQLRIFLNWTRQYTRTCIHLRLLLNKVVWLWTKSGLSLRKY